MAQTVRTTLTTALVSTVTEARASMVWATSPVNVWRVSLASTVRVRWMNAPATHASMEARVMMSSMATDASVLEAPQVSYIYSSSLS